MYTDVSTEGKLMTSLIAAFAWHPGLAKEAAGTDEQKKQFQRTGLNTLGVMNNIFSINNCIAKMEVGCLKHPRASTIGSQLLDKDCSHGWQILATQP